VSRLGAVVGLPIERTILRLQASAFDRPAQQWIEIAGASGARAEALAQTLLSRGATALISVGIAGGLDPRLRPGALVIASEVADPEGARIPTHNAWCERLSALLRTCNARVAPIAGVDYMASSPHQKADLYRKTSAAAVDMESHGVARAAARQAVPFLVLRAVADPADRGLPTSITAGLGANGTIQPLATVAALAARPQELPGLLSVAGNTIAALLSLWRAIRVAGNALGPP